MPPPLDSRIITSTTSPMEKEPWLESHTATQADPPPGYSPCWFAATFCWYQHFLWLGEGCGSGRHEGQQYFRWFPEWLLARCIGVITLENQRLNMWTLACFTGLFTQATLFNMTIGAVDALAACLWCPMRRTTETDYLRNVLWVRNCRSSLQVAFVVRQKSTLFATCTEWRFLRMHPIVRSNLSICLEILAHGWVLQLGISFLSGGTTPSVSCTWFRSWEKS